MNESKQIFKAIIKLHPKGKKRKRAQPKKPWENV